MKDMIDVFIRIGLLAIIVYLCARIFAPFAILMLWGLILAVALYPLHQKLAKKLKDKQGRTATLLVLAGIVLLGVPTILLGSSFADRIYQYYLVIHNNTLTIPYPEASVAEWPLIGGKLHQLWSDAATNLPAVMEKMEPQLRSVSAFLLSTTKNTVGSLFMFIGALVVAGIMMAYGKPGSEVCLRIMRRMGGPERGQRMHKLTAATIRSVATGVVGVAFIQAIILGIGFILADVPAAGVLAMVVLVLGILQLPVIILTLPVVAYLWMLTDASMLSNLFFTVYLIVGGFSDGVLKPLLLGRGVDAPMPIILLGALGGMVSLGLIGLFLGAVILAIGYQIFMDWVDSDEKNTSAQPASSVSTDSVSTTNE